jgi:demethylmenaquinone methyltransferase/2-methoxy-6-polyprenyl-1,4-benzoquinol methylase
MKDMKFDKNRKFVGKMFDEISPTYDRLNHIMSAFQDLRWRRKAVKYLLTINKSYKKIIDLASGSGDFGKEFLKLKPENIFSVDLSFEMLKINRQKIKSSANFQIKADSENLPFVNNCFDLCGIAFGIRNFENLEGCLREINRVLNNNGILFVTEMFKPGSERILNKSFKFYFEKLMPKLGNSVSGSSYAYNYLFESVDNFMTVQNFISLAQNSGFKLIKKLNNFYGIVYSVCFQKT